MMLETGLMVALVITIAGFLVLLDRRDKRAHEERLAHRLEVANLCQRVQAPQVAVMEHNQAQHTEAPGMTPPMSDVEAAKQEELQQVVAEMERLENEALLGRLM